MIKKLRVQFIVISMLSLLLVLTVIITSINYINYRGIVKEADTLLTILETNNGTFPKMEPGSRKKDKPHISPEAPYESRYFSVLINNSGNVSAADTGKIAAIDTAEAIAYARRIAAKNRNRGFIGNYRYLQKRSDTGTRITFLDCGRSLSTFRNFLITSCCISIAGLSAVLCLILLFSKRIIKPVAEGYEKQKRFITDAGHEIKTPLAIIQADVDVLEMDMGENEWLSDIQKQTSRLGDLTNSLICLARMEEQQNASQMIDFSISDIVRETANSFQALAKVQNKNFTCCIQPMLTARGDEKLLRQLTAILLDNAVKYSDDAGTITLTLKKQGRMIHLLVYNTTSSITKKQLEHLFDRFYRTDPSRNSKNGSYGLGLSIAQAIVSAHKGKITASTKDEQSLLVTATLPGAAHSSIRDGI